MMKAESASFGIEGVCVDELVLTGKKASVLQQAQYPIRARFDTGPTAKEVLKISEELLSTSLPVVDAIELLLHPFRLSLHCLATRVCTLSLGQ
jgi:hypothetical protein